MAAENVLEKWEIPLNKGEPGKHYLCLAVINIASCEQSSPRTPDALLSDQF